MNRRNFFSLVLAALGAGAFVRRSSAKLPGYGKALMPNPDAELLAQFQVDYQRWAAKYGDLMRQPVGHSHSISDPGHSHSVNPNWIVCDGGWVNPREFGL